MKRYIFLMLLFAGMMSWENAAFSEEFQGFERLKESWFSGEPNILERFQPSLRGEMKNADAAADAGAQWKCEVSETGETPMTAVVWGVTLNQSEPKALFISGESRSEDISSWNGGDYSLYLDLIYTDGTPRWGVVVPFSASKEWKEERTFFVPEKPVARLTMYAMFRNRTGKAAFRNVRLVEISPEKQGRMMFFDGTQVLSVKEDTLRKTDEALGNPGIRFYLRDAAADSNWFRMTPISGKKGMYGASFTKNEAESGKENTSDDASDPEFTLSHASVSDDNGITYDTLKIRSNGKADRCVTLVEAVPAPEGMTRVFKDLGAPVEFKSEEISDTYQTAAGMRRMNRFPIMGVGGGSASEPPAEHWLGIAPSFPAVYRIFYNSVTNELCLAYDLGFIPEKNEWELHSCRFAQPSGGLRSAWKRYMTAYPEAFTVRTGKMGVWMPFAPISKVENPEDFGFMFKEGSDETQWDDAHGVLTFRYTEPMTWWMRFEPAADAGDKDGKDGENADAGEKQKKNPKTTPELIEAGIAEAARQAQAGNPMAQMWEKSVMYDQEQRPAGRFLDTPWCRGIVWSTSGLPGISEPSDFRAKFSEKFEKETYGNYVPDVKRGFTPGLDGEYIDSAEGYVTTELDFRREHFLAVETPLTFSLETKTPAILRGLTTFEYMRGIEKPIHASGRLMMANSTPIRLSWLAPLMDVLGTETDWNWNGSWTPMGIPELQYRRLLCGGKPYCFLQNTDFTKFTYEMSEKFMQRSLAFGFFPGYFSADASTGHYFSNPKLYNRDRPLFIKYIPLCRLAAEAGWEPETGVTVSDTRLLVERFGRPTSENGGVYYVTIYNPTSETLPAEISGFTNPDLKGKTEILTGASPLPSESVLFLRVTVK